MGLIILKYVVYTAVFPHNFIKGFIKGLKG